MASLVLHDFKKMNDLSDLRILNPGTSTGNILITAVDFFPSPSIEFLGG